MSDSRRYVSRDSIMKFENGYHGYYGEGVFSPAARRWLARRVHKSNRRCAQQLVLAEVREFYAPDPFAWENLPETDLNFCDACNEYHASSFWLTLDDDWDAEKHAPEFQYDDSLTLEDFFRVR